MGPTLERFTAGMFSSLPTSEGRGLRGLWDGAGGQEAG